jgi:hypothetical protein
VNGCIESPKLEIVMTNVITLTKLSIELGESLDTVRRVVRNTPGLKNLGIKVGTGRIYTQAEARKITQALQTRKTALTATA